MVAVAVGVLVWGISTWLNILSLPWSVIVALSAFLVISGLGFYLLRKSDTPRRRIASGVRAGRNVRISNVTSNGALSGQSVELPDVASDVRASGDVEISDIRDDHK